MQLDMYNMQAEKVGDTDLGKDVLTGEVNTQLLREALIAHQANARQGTAATKTRGKVRGGGRKPWPQKGTGRARAGSIRSPLWVGGGVTFGPKPRSFRQKFPRRKKKRALACALELAIQEQRLVLVDELKVQHGKTREMAEFLQRFAPLLDVKGKVLVIVAEKNEQLHRACSNIPGLHVVLADNVGTFHLLSHDAVIAEQAAIKAVLGRIGND